MKLIYKILKLFRKQKMEVKMGIIYLIGGILFVLSILSLNSVAIILTGGALCASMPYYCLTNFTDEKNPTLNKILDKLINKIEEYIKPNEKEVLQVKKLEELTHGSIVRDYSEIPEAPRLNIEGSIIRSSSEISKEKTDYVSLLEYVKMYQTQEEGMKKINDEPVSVIENDRGPIYLKK